ncbi:positive regulator of sigma E, RseC/MucC [Clostridium sp. DL-VIII]|uniref:SoxR reducing system RseC family protein n=1 Tax=Clostridium sp. DL-VIII TaxID=641107 RepID=UPI00023AF9E6|nr:SoxR reducing system RseC family protein [Clostridium sp. DL-VIII]EHI99364.1 positive regulator of sigma E, RseC/MucC [Clostridium sp. DL-VIII]
MKTEQGLVIETSNDMAKIRVGRHNDCKNCGACPGSDSIIINADNKIGAKPGQRVSFEVKETNVLSAAFIVFVLPLIALFIGVMVGGFLGQYIGVNIRMLQIIGGIIALILAIIAVKIFDKAANKSKKSQPVIVRIL